MSNKLTKVLEKIEKIVTEMNTFNFTPRDPVPSIDRETISFVVESDVIGRDSEKEKIVSELMDPQRERDNISVLGMVGLGGLGKTTLAQLVFNDERVKGHFQLLLWVCVSTEFNVANIIKSIIQVARNEGDASTFNKEVLQRQLRENLDRKRYLLVLDDVWNEEREKWDELRMLLFSGVGSGSIIIVTTRSQSVASIMKTLPHHELTLFNEEDSWSLFEKRAFDATVEESREELVEIGTTIVRKCAGLPLIVKEVGGLMGTKREVHEWRAISENKILDGLQYTGNVLPILELSYHHLPSHIKQCFAFCAIFPRNYEIRRDTLIQLWMVNDFIPTDGSMENLEDKGQYIFNELYWRSFFQNMIEKKTYCGSIITCKMHDLMHDLATTIAKSKCYIILELNSPGTVQKEIHHLSLTNEKSLGINDVLKQFPTIHTYLFNPKWIGQNKEKHSFLLKSSSLRALQFPLRCAPKELGYIKHIRYLDLSHRMFETLPKTISTLYNLQTLKLSNSRIRELPIEMRYMIKLRHLFLDGCSNLKRMPIGLGQLKCLRTLTNYIANYGKGRSIKELKKLNLLCGHMSLSRLESVRDWEDAKTVNLAAKTNLCSLKLVWNEAGNKGATKNDQAVLEALTPHNKLRNLEITGYSGFCFPKWLKDAMIIRNLNILMLYNCVNCIELPPLWQLPSLEILDLGKMESLTHIISNMCKHVEGSKSLITFSTLKMLKLWYLPNLVSWHEERF